MRYYASEENNSSTVPVKNPGRPRNKFINKP
jgi:hypothetical protein